MYLNSFLPLERVALLAFSLQITKSILLIGKLLLRVNQQIVVDIVTEQMVCGVRGVSMINLDSFLLSKWMALFIFNPASTKSTLLIWKTNIGDHRFDLCARILSNERCQDIWAWKRIQYLP